MLDSALSYVTISQDLARGRGEIGLPSLQVKPTPSRPAQEGPCE
jgi:hypothetical protein